MIQLLLIITTICVITPVFSDTTTISVQDLAAQLNAQIPQAQVDEVIEMDYEGFYAVLSGHELMYYHAPSQLLISGQLVDIEKKLNISTKMREILLARLYTQLPLHKAIQLKQGTGERQVIMFTDPHCRYCVKLEDTLRDIKNLTVYIMPVAFLGTQSTETLQKIYCSNNVKKSWTDWKTSHRFPDNIQTKCSSLPHAKDPDEFHLWSQRLGIRGVPALFFPSGQIITGSVPLQHIENIINTQ